MDIYIYEDLENELHFLPLYSHGKSREKTVSLQSIIERMERDLKDEKHSLFKHKDQDLYPSSHIKVGCSLMHAPKI